MADFDRRPIAAGARGPDVAFDAGLRAFMLNVYNYMGAGVAITGLAAYGLYAYAASSEAVFSAIFTSPLRWLIVLAPLGYGFYLIMNMRSMTFSGARTGFFIYAALVGLSLAGLFVMFTGQSIARVFFITAATFGATSLYGYTTKRDLTAIGSFLWMGLIGIIIASLVNLFLASTALQFAVSVMGVLIFTGLTAYDTQKLKNTYLTYEHNGEAVAKASIWGALQLYLDFINLFLMMMQLMGDRRS
jgi:FtsH-binding integral membrane protein